MQCVPSFTQRGMCLFVIVVRRAVSIDFPCPLISMMSHGTHAHATKAQCALTRFPGVDTSVLPIEPCIETVTVLSVILISVASAEVCRGVRAGQREEGRTLAAVSMTSAGELGMDGAQTYIHHVRLRCLSILYGLKHV